MNKLIITLFVALATSLSASAQKFLDQLRFDESGQGHVTVTQSEAIDSLVNGDVAVKKNSDAARKEANGKKTEEGGLKKVARTNFDADANGTVDNRKKVLRNAHKTKGYRIQVYSGGNSREDKSRAEAAGAAVKSNFPSQPVYVHFYSPSWKCRMGNFTKIEEARAALARVKSMGYKQACIVQGTINVQY